MAFRQKADKEPLKVPLTGRILYAVSLTDDVRHFTERHSQQDVHELHRLCSTFRFNQTFGTTIQRRRRISEQKLVTPIRQSNNWIGFIKLVISELTVGIF